MKKCIREGLGKEIEEFLEWFLSQDKYDNVALRNGKISACSFTRGRNPYVTLELNIKDIKC